MPTQPSLRTWLPVVLWTALIALESSYGSSANTGSILYAVATRVFGHIDRTRFELAHHLLRKTGHFLGYGILGYLWFRAFSRTLAHESRMKCAALATGCAFVIASLDELHQSFSPARTGQFSDVVLDTCGAVLLIGVAMLLARRTTFPGREQRVISS